MVTPSASQLLFPYAHISQLYSLLSRFQMRAADATEPLPLILAYNTHVLYVFSTHDYCRRRLLNLRQPPLHTHRFMSAHRFISLAYFVPLADFVALSDFMSLPARSTNHYRSSMNSGLRNRVLCAPARFGSAMSPNTYSRSLLSYPYVFSSRRAGESGLI